MKTIVQKAAGKFHEHGHGSENRDWADGVD